MHVPVKSYSEFYDQILCPHKSGILILGHIYDCIKDYYIRPVVFSSIITTLHYKCK